MKKKYILLFIIFLAFFLFWFQFFFWSWMTIWLDATWTPFLGFHNFFSQSIFWHIKDFLMWIFWYQFMSRFYLFITFLLAVWLAILFYKKVVWKINFWVLFPISFIVINPFFYERLLTQPGILMWILFLWYGILFLVEEIINKKNISFKKDIYIWLFFALAFSLMPHSIFMIWVILLAYLLVNYRNIFQTLKKIWIILWIVLLINFNWLVWTFFLWTNHTVSEIWTFNKANVEVFQVNDLVLKSSELTTLQLWWFWGERYRHIFLPYEINKQFYIAWFIILLFIFYWFYLVFRQNKKLFYFLLLIWLISWILWTWTASKIWWNLVWYLYNNIPFYKWLREPGKWIGLLMIVYMIVIFFASSDILKRIRNLKKEKVFFTLYFLLLLAWVPTVMFWFKWQLFLTDYPKEYKELKNIIPKSYQKIKYVIFPWHSYMACDWTRWKVIANVFDKVFYPIKTLKASNIEMRTSKVYLYSNYKNKNKFVEKFLQTKDLNYLKNNGIWWIIYLKTCADFWNYKWLNTSNWLKKIYSWNNLNVYIFKKQKILNSLNKLLNE